MILILLVVDMAAGVLISILKSITIVGGLIGLVGSFIDLYILAAVVIAVLDSLPF